MDSDNTNTQIKLLRERIVYSQQIFNDYTTYNKALDRLLEDSKYIALSLRFPYQDFYDMELPKKYYNWQLRCCEQLYKLIGTAGIKSYSENGLSWTRDSSYLPYDLTSEIEPMVGYIKKESENNDV